MKNYLILFITISFLGSCRLEQKTNNERLNIVTTTGIIEDVVENIVGDSADVASIMGPGTDPHLYKPAPSDIEMLDEADVIIANGLHLEGKMSELLHKYANEKPVIWVSDGIDESDLIKSADFADSYDPHIWFDWKLWMRGMSYVKDELIKLDTNRADYFSLNYDQYLAEVTKVDMEIKADLNSISDSSKILITSHDAFSYFGRRYAIEVKGIQGISTLSEVGLKEIAEMVDFVIEKKIKSIFVETSTSQKTAQSIVDGCGDKGYKVNLDGPLYSDALGEPDSDGGTYIGMMKTNVRIIVEGLK